MDFVTGLPLSADWKSDSYDRILVIINRLTKMARYKFVKVTINAQRPAKVIVNVVVRHHDLPNFIISDWGAIFVSNFSLRSLTFLASSNAFLPHDTLRWTGKRKQNSRIKISLCAFINW